MNHTYKLTKGNLKIKTPGVASIQDIKVDILHQSPERTVSKSTYPNGFELTFDQCSDHITITCNRELTIDADGSLVAPTI